MRWAPGILPFIAATLLSASVARASADVPSLRENYRETRLRAQRIEARWGTTIEPLRIRDAAALRFILRRDWEAFTAKGGFDPRETYSPKPATWDQWQSVTETEVTPAALRGDPITFEALASWNRNALRGTVPESNLPGTLKPSNNYGANLRTADALSHEEVAALRSFRFTGETEPALGWTALRCQSELQEPLRPDQAGTRECGSIYREAYRWSPTVPFWEQTWNDMSRGLLFGKWYWFACWPRVSAEEEALRERNCGMLSYPPHEDVERRLGAVLRRVNALFARDLSKEPENKVIAEALRAQREIVAIHPFLKGNGRASRWVMDSITTRAGLPPILVFDMDRDLSTPEEEYLSLGIRGARESVERMGRCLDRLEERGPAALERDVCGLL